MRCLNCGDYKEKAFRGLKCDDCKPKINPRNPKMTNEHEYQESEAMLPTKDGWNYLGWNKGRRVYSRLLKPEVPQTPAETLGLTVGSLHWDFVDNTGVREVLCGDFYMLYTKIEPEGKKYSIDPDWCYPEEYRQVTRDSKEAIAAMGPVEAEAALIEGWVLHQPYHNRHDWCLEFQGKGICISSSRQYCMDSYRTFTQPQEPIETLRAQLAEKQDLINQIQRLTS